MDDCALVPPQSPLLGADIIGSADEMKQLSAFKLQPSIATANPKVGIFRSHSAPAGFMEGDKTPPLLSPNLDEMKVEKKRSPTSTFDFNHAEEMKVPVPEELYQDSLVKILHELIPKPLSECSQDVNWSNSAQDMKDYNTPSPSNEEPSLQPVKQGKHHKVLHRRIECDRAPLKVGRGELTTLSLADEALENHDFEKALKLYKSLLQDFDKKHGRDNYRTAHCVHQIGECYLLLGDFGKAIHYLETAINIRSRVLGTRHLDVATSMEKLAVAQLHLNEVEVAHDVYRNALRIKRSLLGLYHEDIAHIQTQLACIYFYSGELLSAQSAFEEALEIYEKLVSKSMGNQNVWLTKCADTLGSMGSIKLSQKKYFCAVAYFSDALKAQIQVYGLYHPLVIISLDNLGYAHSKSKRYVQATEVYEEMLYAQTTFFEGYNLDCYETLKKLTLVYCKMEKIDAAIDATLEAIAAQQREPSPDTLVFEKTQRLLYRLEKKLLVGKHTKRSS